MDGLYAIHSPEDYSVQSRIELPEDILFPVNHQLSYSDYLDLPAFGSPHLLPSAVSDAGSVAGEKQSAAPVEEGMITDAIRTKIASHPLYPKLLDAYIDCQKVGAPPEIAYQLDEIRLGTTATSTCYGDDPELDEFMDKYCSILVKYKSDLSRPFEEASSFLNKIETQLNTLCNGASTSYVTGKPAKSALIVEGLGRHCCPFDEVANSSDEDLSAGETELECPPTNEDRELKDKLLRKYSGYITTLKQEFSKKKKKGKLPNEARQNLLDWWNVHYKWPYPTEADKVSLAELTGLDQKQINNWFINQRKRHWRPSENMQFAVMDRLYGPFLMKG